MAEVNKVTARRDNASMGSSFVEVTGLESIRTNATCSSTIREMLDVDGCLPPIYEDPTYLTPVGAFTELCATCLHSGTRKEATHYCPGCDRRGRYMCGNCLKAHSVWCNKTEHEVQSLSVDRQSDPESCYHTIEQSEPMNPYRSRDNPVPTDSDYVNRWLINNNDSENSEATLTQSKGNGRNLHEHHAASSLGVSMSDDISYDETGTTLYQRPTTGRSVSQHLEGQYEEIAFGNQEATSHIYCDPIEMPRFPRIPDPHRRYVGDPCDWEDMRNATARRLNDVYNEQNTRERLAALASRHENAERLNKKKKSCVIQ